MSEHVVILGGGTGGTLTANRLRKRFRRDDLAITVVDQDRDHVYQPGLLFLPFGLAHGEDLVRPRERQLKTGIDFVESGIDHVDVEARQVPETRSAVRSALDALLFGGADVDTAVTEADQTITEALEDYADENF